MSSVKKPSSIRNPFSQSLSQSTIKSGNSQSSASHQVKRKTGVVIEEIHSEMESNSHKDKAYKKLCLQRKISDDKCYCVLLPLVLDSNLKPFKQPILVRIQMEMLSDFGFALPFNEYMSEKNNFFEMNFNKTCFTAQILAIGDSPIDVKKCLKMNLKLNPQWRNLNIMIGNGNKLIELIHRPLVENGDVPSQKVLGPSAIKQIFGQNEKQLSSKNKDQNSENTESTNDATVTNKKASSVVVIDRDADSPYNKFDKIKKDDKVKDTVREDGEKSVDSSNYDLKLEKIKSIVDELNRKKFTLSERDTTGSLLLSIIEAIVQIADALQKKNQRFIRSANSVPVKDRTYKNQPKNQIFLEGIIQLDLNSYEFALKNSRPDQPASFAYQIVHFCFPKQYYADITLGKKFLVKPELDKILNKRSKCVRVKLPLQYVWGFKDPFSEPLTGDSDLNLGQERITSFINHIFRKCEIFHYSQEMEFKVRNRISKEISSLNSKKKVKDQTDTDESMSGEIDNRKNLGRKNISDEESNSSDDGTESGYDNPWNINCFMKKK